MDASDVDALAGGGNFRLDTDLGPLDVMQWIAGIDADNLYAELDACALTFTLDDLPLRYCSLGHLRAMKEAAGRVIWTTSSTCRQRTPDGHRGSKAKCGASTTSRRRRAGRTLNGTLRPRPGASALAWLRVPRPSQLILGSWP